MGVWYCTREDVKSALDVRLTARIDAQLDRAIEAASRGLESLLHRHFYPLITTRRFDWPTLDSTSATSLFLGRHEALSLTAVTSGGVPIPLASTMLEPVNDGPPYSRLEIDRSTSYALSSGSTPQRSVALTGTFAGCATEESAPGALAAAVLYPSTSTIYADAATSAAIGSGSVIRIDDERMIVASRSMSTTTATLSSGLTAAASATSVAVADASLVAPGEILLVGSERMLVTDTSTGLISVRRAWDGTTLASHDVGDTIYALRALHVTRGALGTSAASHLVAATIYLLEIPGPVRTLCIAETVNKVLQEQSGWARTVGTGDAERPLSGQGLEDLRRDAMRSNGRRARMRSV